ncbi:MAG: ABC transporter ATP-binding protein [Rhodospirillales bacterium]|nr:ABC transporter ATP-binding protein [Rhodospirillales bacterium]
MNPDRTTGDSAATVAHSVTVEGVSKSFGPVLALHEVTLPVRRGEVLTLLGPSGCGKTTLLNLIAGFEKTSAGRICIDEQDVTDVPPHQRDTGMVFQSYALFPHMNVFENVAFGLRMRKLPPAEVEAGVRRALEMVKLEGLEHRRVRQLSGGQQQRVALARAIVVRPKVLLLDEPLSALDKNLRGQMQFELKELHQKTGLTTIFVTHDQGEALSLSDRIVVMNRGQIQQISTPLDLYRRPANGFVASFIGEINHLPLATWTERDNGILLEFANGARLAAPRRVDLMLTPGRPMHVFVRPEHITIAAPGAAGPNVISGKIVSHIYQGTHTITRIDSAKLGVLDLRVPGGDIIGRFPVAATVEVEINLAEAVMLSEERGEKGA